MTEKVVVDQLEKYFQFPGRFKISLCRENKTKENSIVTTQISNPIAKKKLENVKFSESQSIGFYCRYVALEIIDCNTAEELGEHIQKADAFWIKGVENDESS